MSNTLARMAQGQWLNLYLRASPEACVNPTQRARGEILTRTTTFPFNGSDLMPGEIGASRDPLHRSTSGRRRPSQTAPAQGEGRARCTTERASAAR